ncbi:myosin light chain kinase 3-like [Carassius carassius]|uniref:myosin light chain kinase 3-like n=1 Tax=Carassius carassius TaxID=217509 RepID=UPI00286845FA|nr:myosin light chain kinase 3-like [Carassius carassius]
MSKQATLASCIAKLYEGGRLENSGTPSGTVKKTSPTLIGSLSNVEVKLHALEGKVEQIKHTQTEVLHKLSSLCQGMEALERSLIQHKQGAQEANVIKNGQRESNNLPLLTEVRSLCGETVDLLHNLKQENQQQREKIECMESSLSTLEKVLGYVGNAFRNSKVVEFILNGVVPWRKQGLLNTVEEEVSKILQNTADFELQQPEVTVPTGPSSLPFPEALTGEHKPLTPVSTEVRSKALRKAKEVTVKSRAPAQVQTFASDIQLEEENDVPTNAECVTVTTTKVEKDLALPQERALEQADASQVGEESSFKSVVPEQQVVPKVEVPQKQAEVSQVDDEASLKRSVPGQQQLEKDVPHKPLLCTKKPVDEVSSQHKETVESVTPVPKHDEGKTESEPANKKNENKTIGKILESDAIKNCAATSPQKTAIVEGGKAKSSPLRKAESQLMIIDDSPPLPAPFEHRIVSAKQVPMNAYYAVKPDEVLGGGRFGQVHKCAELSSGLTLAAKIIKVRGMKERDEVKNEIGVMNQLNHANLIQLYDAFESRTNLTLIMEYVEGGELFERIIDENYQLTELDAIVFTRQICEGVQYLHQQYILHLDLKPENILCVNTTGNQIKIIDFGLARKYRPREKLKVNFGTPEFLAPEVVNYDFVSFPTDMWSVGVITYMLLSGLSPFMGDNDTETMNNIMHANWDFDAEAFENVSEEAKDFISSLLVTAKCSRMSASGCMKHSWLNNLEDKAKVYKVWLKSQMRLQRYLAAHRQWKKHFYAVAAANRLKRFQQSRSVSTPN